MICANKENAIIALVSKKFLVGADQNWSAFVFLVDSTYNKWKDSK